MFYLLFVKPVGSNPGKQTQSIILTPFVPVLALPRGVGGSMLNFAHKKQEISNPA